MSHRYARADRAASLAASPPDDTSCCACTWDEILGHSTSAVSETSQERRTKRNPRRSNFFAHVALLAMVGHVTVMVVFRFWVWWCICFCVAFGVVELCFLCSFDVSVFLFHCVRYTSTMLCGQCDYYKQTENSYEEYHINREKSGFDIKKIKTQQQHLRTGFSHLQVIKTLFRVDTTR